MNYGLPKNLVLNGIYIFKVYTCSTRVFLHSQKLFKDFAEPYTCPEFTGSKKAKCIDFPHRNRDSRYILNINNGTEITLETCREVCIRRAHNDKTRGCCEFEFAKKKCYWSASPIIEEDSDHNAILCSGGMKLNCNIIL